jgi:hypothetical protein
MDEEELIIGISKEEENVKLNFDENDVSGPKNLA